MRRTAFTFIELVFSIVIVGIVILSIPLIIRQSNANSILSQNVIGYYNALTLINTIKRKPWDANNVGSGDNNNFVASGGYYILQTGNNSLDCRVLDKGSNVYSKPGLGISDRRRMCDPKHRRAAAITPSNSLDNIGAFHKYTQTVSSGGTKFFTITVAVRYVDINYGSDSTTGEIFDTANQGVGNGPATDIKRITLQLHRNFPDGSSELVSTYTYYAANVGTDVPFSKDNL